MRDVKLRKDLAKQQELAGLRRDVGQEKVQVTELQATLRATQESINPAKNMATHIQTVSDGNKQAPRYKNLG